MLTPFTAALIEREPELGLRISKSARAAIFGHFPSLAGWYRKAYRPILLRQIGAANMIDEFASEMYLAIEQGETEDEAFRTACKETLGRWYREYAKRNGREMSTEVIADLRVIDTYPSLSPTHSEWGPRYLLAQKALASMTDKQREAVLLYAECQSPTEVGEALGLSKQAAFNRVQAAQKQANKKYGDELAGLVPIR